MGVVKLADYRHNPVQHQEASSMGYVSIHRQFMDSRLYKDSQAVHLWLHLILKANHESTVVNTDIGPITVDRGQMITVWGSDQFWVELVQPGRTGKPCVARGVVIWCDSGRICEK